MIDDVTIVFNNTAPTSVRPLFHSAVYFEDTLPVKTIIVYKPAKLL